MISEISNVEGAIEDLRKGRMVILVDDENRENEGDLVIAADKVTPEAINFMSIYGRGLICLPMSEILINRLKLPMMVEKNNSPYKTAFTVSIEARTGVSTGISAHDRAHTIQTAIGAEVNPEDIISPGHVFPLKAKKMGVLERQGQTEGSVDLARLAGLTPAAVICEIINDDGRMARGNDLKAFANKHNIRIVTIESLISYRMIKEQLVEELASAMLPIESLGNFTIKVFGNRCDNSQHIALIKPPYSEKPLVRIHSECLTGDVLGSSQCDCGTQLQNALEEIDKQGGVLLYMRQEGRGIGLVNKIKAYALQQEKGLDTVEANMQLGLPADKRDYAMSAQILRYLGISQCELLTNNPEKVKGLEQFGIKVKKRVPTICAPTEHNLSYLTTKKVKMGHLLDIASIVG